MGLTKGAVARRRWWAAVVALWRAGEDQWEEGIPFWGSAWIITARKREVGLEVLKEATMVAMRKPGVQVQGRNPRARAVDPLLRR